MLYKWLKALFSRVVIITALILVQVGLLVFAVWKLSDYFVYWYISWYTFIFCWSNLF